MKLAEVVERILLQGLDLMERMDTECNLNTVPSSMYIAEKVFYLRALDGSVIYPMNQDVVSLIYHPKEHTELIISIDFFRCV